MVVQGPAAVDAELPTEATLNPRDVPRSCREIKPEDRLIAVVAAREVDGVLLPESLQVITDRVKDRRIAWQAPEGSWRVMAFWSTFPDDSPTVNHIDKQAMAHYVDYLGQRYVAAVGDEFGKTVDSLFGDSFEVPIHRNGIYWADSLPEEFRARKGYDLVAHLPALWWELGEITPKVRYDVNDVLHQVGMEAFYGTFVPWCKAHGVKSRVQPYGFVTDVLEGSGAVDIPEMEITAGEKDAVPWFDTRIGPREYVASGAHLYGRNVVSTEAYTFLHWQPYRATLEELKIASDVFLRSGANKFYNHGFLATPEHDIAPTRGFYEAIHISPDNVWWPYYHLVSDYIARCCYLLRQGSPQADVAVYSPLANQWTQDAFNARRWTRDFDWGNLGGYLIANGYNFDLVNDDVLQRRASFDGALLKAGEMTYRALVLPNVAALPLETLRRVEAYAAQGGVVIALERVPEASCGTRDHAVRDREVRELSSRLFGKASGPRAADAHAYGEGSTYWLTRVLFRGDPLDQVRSSLDPFLNALRRHVTPDMALDLVNEDLRENEGLCFVHRRQDARDIYFVTNVQDRAIDLPVAFRVAGAAPWEWDPYTGVVRPRHEYREQDGVTHVRLRLAPYESTFVVFEKGDARPHVVGTSLAGVEDIDDQNVTAWADRAGEHYLRLDSSDLRRVSVSNLPAPYRITTPWQLVLEGPGFPRYGTVLDELVSWTLLPEAKHFSGTGVYSTEFDLPEAYTGENVQLELDLGHVGNVAEVTLNGKLLDTVWMRGQRLVLPAQAGRNRLEVRVTNTLINRVSGLGEFPPVPEELQPRLGRGLQDATSPANALRGFEPLPPSGLLGPVEVVPYARVRVPVKGR
jgi:hypothetical protein